MRANVFKSEFCANYMKDLRKNDWYVMSCVAAYHEDEEVALLTTDERLQLPGGSDFPNVFAHQILQCVLECRPKKALREPPLRVKRDNEP